MVIYIGAFLSMCTHFNLTQTVMAKFGWLMSVTFKTTGVESASLIANIFLSPVRHLCSLAFVIGHPVRWSPFFKRRNSICYPIGRHPLATLIAENFVYFRLI